MRGRGNYTSNQNPQKADNSVQTTYKRAQQKTEFVQNGPNGRSTNVNYLENRNDKQQEEVENENKMTKNEPVEFAELTSMDGCEEYQLDKFSAMAISEAFKKNSV